MLACVLIPRFALRVAGGGHGGEPAVLAPLPGGSQVVGEASRAAESQGVHAGMRLGEALARCPSLRLVPGDPARVAELWETVLQDLEGIGAHVESGRAGEAFFSVDGLRGIHGGTIEGVLQDARAGVRLPIQIAAAPCRFAAYAAASRGARLPRAVSGESAEAIVPPGALKTFLAPLPVSVLVSRLDVGEHKAGELVASLKRFGIRTLGALGALSTSQVADRFGPPGVQALSLARGEDTPLRPRDPHEEIEAELDLPEGMAGAQLDHALELLVDRLLAHPRLGQRTVMSLRLSARLCGGGSWSEEQTFGYPTAVASKVTALLASRLESLPGPAEQLRLRALTLGTAAADQLELSLEDVNSRRTRIAAALRAVRAANGTEALLKVIDADPRSRIPERRFFLAPFQAQ